MFAAGKTAAVSGAGPDDKFNYVTMLLHGDGTNGAQNNTFLDSSTNNFTITRNGNTTQGSFSPYGSNWSNYFDGSGDYLTTSSSQIIPTGSFTVECFAFVTGSGNNQKFVSQGTSGSAGRFSVGIEGGNWFVQLAGDVIQTGTPVRNQWNYVAVTYNGSTITLYINGTSIGTVSSTANAQNTTLTIGQDWNSYITTGYISNVRVSNTVRTVTTTPTTPFTSDGNTRLLACQSNRFLDSSANAFALTVNGDTSVQRFNPFGASTAYSTSVIGGSGYFDGSGDYLTAPDNAGFSLGSNNFTIESWVYPTASPAQPMIIGQWTSSYAWTMQLSNDSNRYLRALLHDGSFNDYVSSTSLQLNAWNHCAFVRESNTVSLYLNGARVYTTTFSGTVTNSTSAVSVGADSSGGQPLQGYITNSRVVNGTALYSGTTYTIPTAPLTAITNTQLLLNTINAGIFDNAMMNDLETVGNAQISTSVKKYGTGSLYFDGTGDYLFEPTTQLLAWGTGNFTIEMWINTSTTSVSGGASRTMWGTSSASYQGQLYLEISTGKVVFGNTGSTFIKGTSNVADGNWNHIAISRSGTTCRLFVNGTQEASGTNSVNYDAQPTFIGAFGASDGFFNGYIDDLRITKGYARYTTTFTPPTSALSDTGPY